ncbi:MAG: ABC-F type ribosomal protection protein [Oscillospiraceae bacterium]|nr:ABC-F type ribosomal protection protein [Oscillospiraceae bacterium]
MSMIKVEDLTFAYPGHYDNVFENVSFQLDTDWKLGFVGRNGRGKTTFLNLLMGKYEYEGRITAPTALDYFPYPVPDGARLTGEVLEGICPQAQEWELVRELSRLELEEEILERPFGTLSNGEQTKALLAALFLREGSFLLIDEPTNHLDSHGRELVAEYLRGKRGFILVSHDRRFLDGCVDHILSLNRTSVDVRSGNFSTWMENFQRQQEFEESQSQRLQKDVKRLKQAARRTSDWSDKVEATKNGTRNSGLRPDKGYIGHKAAKMMKRSKTIESRQEKALEEKESLLKDRETAQALKLSPLTYRSEVLAEFDKVEVVYGSRTVCPPASFQIRRGERLVLEGPNGSGKSSLLKLLMGQEIGHRGTVRKGSGLVISYVPQDTSHLSGSLGELAERAGIDESLFKTILRKMDFERVQFEKDMRDLSQGQKKKALIAKSLCKKAHLYVWDEPLNFIDLYSRMQIEELILEFAPTMLMVEHDAAFRETVGTRTLSLPGTKGLLSKK